ncbi:MAG: hypothetical protein OEV33_03745, partial [Armatimonadota bacterium]|nr:hypothetical protein [Armatimonadota bacterium]
PPSSELDQPYCARDHDVAWTTRFSWQQAEHLISSNLGAVLGRPELSPGTLESLRIVNTRNAERVAWLDISTSKGTYRVRGDAIRWLFGTGHPGAKGLRSTAFALELEEDTRHMPRALILQGTGHGHGIGLCQWGARGRALAGQTAREILAAYYPGATVTDLRR